MDKLDLKELTPDQRARIDDVLKSSAESEPANRKDSVIESAPTEEPIANGIQSESGTTSETVIAHPTDTKVADQAIEPAIKQTRQAQSKSSPAEDLENVLNDGGAFNRLLNKVGAQGLTGIAMGASEDEKR